MPIQKHQVKSKLAVAYLLSHTPEMAGHIPDTSLFSEESLKSMVKKYDKVYVKPDRGRKSRGIIRIERLKSGRFGIRYESQTIYVSSKGLVAKVKSLVNGKRYLIQKAIRSVTKEDRPFDLRCHVLRINGQWRIGGICGRLGKRGSFVTTSHAGGTPTLLGTLLTRHLKYSDKEKEEMIAKLEKCGVTAVTHVSRMYPNLKDYAVDMGIDPKRRIWIYEVNIEPLIKGNFGLLPDKTLYRRIRNLRKIAK